MRRQKNRDQPWLAMREARRQRRTSRQQGQSDHVPQQQDTLHGLRLKRDELVNQFQHQQTVVAETAGLIRSIDHVLAEMDGRHVSYDFIEKDMAFVPQKVMEASIASRPPDLMSDVHTAKGKPKRRKLSVREAQKRDEMSRRKSREKYQHQSKPPDTGDTERGR